MLQHRQVKRFLLAPAILQVLFELLHAQVDGTVLLG